MAGGGNGTLVDYEALERWTRMAMSRGMGSRKGERRQATARRLLNGISCRKDPRDIFLLPPCLSRLAA
jgi:hypothetical protein